MKSILSERQNQVYEFIRSYSLQYQRPPTIKEIGSALEIRSTNGVHKILHVLEKKGYIRREPNSARGLVIIDGEKDAYDLDEVVLLIVISRTASDTPEKLREKPNGSLSIDTRLLRKAENLDKCLIGRAGDDGMNGEGIRKGDFVIVEEMAWQELQNGELAAFLVRDSFLIRRFFFANGRIHLRPADRTYTEETFLPNDPANYVVGRLITMIRRY